MNRAALFLLLASIPATVLARDYKPAVCQSAVPYAGAPLHAKIAAEVFPKPGQDFSGALDPALVKSLEEAVDWVLKNTKAPGITAAVAIPGQGLWTASRGLLRTEPPAPLPEEHYFHWASAGKAFTAAVVMRLVEEGKLGYDDKLVKWFPKFPNAKVITIDHLLTHTNGIYSFNHDEKLRRKGHVTPEEAIRTAEKHGNGFCPGERWYYSNTGYVLLGNIVEKVEGRPFHEVVTEKIIKPLGLTRTIALAPRQDLKGLAVGHAGGKPDLEFEPTTPFSAGNIASTAKDMVTFWSALLSGRIVGPEAVRQAFDRLYPMFDSPGLFYGRGVMLAEFDDEGRNVWLSHSGGTPGLKSVAAYDTGAGVFVAVALNGDVSAEASANKLLKEVRRFLSSRLRSVP